MLEAERLEAERLLNNNTPIKTTYPIKEEIISELVDTSDEPNEINTGRNRYAADGYKDQLNMQLNKLLYA
jgi:hypothetical protein